MARPTNLELAASKVLRKKNRDKGGGAGKYGRNRAKCARYRARVGKPLGPGREGNRIH
jgi:hypothetical protein